MSQGPNNLELPQELMDDVKPVAKSEMKTLLTEKELAQKVVELRKTSILRSIFPIHDLEIKRIIRLISMFATISFTYAYLRLFKDRIVYSVLDNTETKNWLKLLTFFVTQKAVVKAQSYSLDYSFNVAFTKITNAFAILLIVNTVFIVFSRFAISPGQATYSDLIFVAESLTSRGFKVLYPLLIVINQIAYSSFYVLAEVIGSMMVSFCFTTYVNNNTTEDQNGRFMRVLLFFSNLSSLLAGFIYKSWVRVYEKRPKADSDIFYIIFPTCAVSLYYFVLYIKAGLEKEFLNEIVVSSKKVKAVEKGAVEVTTKIKKKPGFKDSLYYMVNSRFLMAMCGLSFFYNVSANLLETANSCGMAAAAAYLGVDKSFFATGFKSFDLIFTSIATSCIVISPISLLPQKFGIRIFAFIPLFIATLGAIIQFILGLVNYPLTGNDNIWPFHNLNFANKFPYAEAVCGTMVQSLIKISKYAFFDIVKESIAMKIDPTDRPLFKGVFDGSITKFGKSVGSIYGIVMFNIFQAADARYYFPVTALLIGIFGILWFTAVNYVSRSYKKAKENESYVDPDYIYGEIKA